jgi:transcription initiation factor TFIID subunit 5
MAGQRINTLTWSPDGQWLAAGLDSGEIILWDMQRYRPVDLLMGHADQVVGLNWSRDGSLLASNGLDGTVLIWKMP